MEIAARLLTLAKTVEELEGQPYGCNGGYFAFPDSMKIELRELAAMSLTQAKRMEAAKEVCLALGIDLDESVASTLRMREADGE